MQNLEKKLKFLEEKRKSLNKRMVDFEIGSRSSYGVMNKQDKLKYILNNICRQTLEIFDDGSFYECAALKIRMPVVSCLARRFLPSHPAHKKCRKCKVLDKYIDQLILEIEKNEKQGPLSV